MLTKLETLDSGLTLETRDKLLAYHNEGYSIPHCIRWGAQGSEEVLAEIC